MSHVIEVGPVRTVKVKAYESIYKEAVAAGSFSGTFEEFIAYLQAGLPPEELKAAVSGVVEQEIQSAAFAAALKKAVDAAVARAVGQSGNSGNGNAATAPAGGGDSGVSNEALRNILSKLGVNENE